MKRLMLAALAATGLFSAAYAQSAPDKAAPVNASPGTPSESWIYAGMPGGAMGWDASSIARDAEAGTASAMRFFYFADPLHGEKTDFTWVFQDIEFDCRADTFRLMDGSFFNKARRGRTDKPGSDTVLPVRPNTPEAVLEKVLCDSATVKGAAEASNMADAMDGAEKAALPEVDA